MNDSAKLPNGQATIASFTTETFKRRFAMQAAPWSESEEPCKIVKIQEVIPFLKFPLPIHRTASFDILFVTQGAPSTKHCGLKKYMIEPPQLFFKAGGKITSGEIYGTDTQGYYCLCQPDFLTTYLGLPTLASFTFFQYGHSPLIEPTSSQLERFSFLFATLHQLYQSASTDKFLLMASYLNVILQEAAILHQIQHQSAVSSVVSSAEALTARFNELVGQFYLTKQGVHEYAELLSVTPNYLTKVVRQTSGKTALAVIHDMILI